MMKQLIEKFPDVAKVYESQKLFQSNWKLQMIYKDQLLVFFTNCDAS